jgi:hypothetical protein
VNPDSRPWFGAGQIGTCDASCEVNKRCLWWAKRLRRFPAIWRCLYSGAVTFLIVKALALITDLRTAVREEGLGLDFTQHGEEAYSRGEGAILLLDRRTE